MQDVTISPDGKIALPEDALEALSVKPGDKLRFSISGNKVKVVSPRPATQSADTQPYETPPKVPINPDRQIILPQSALEALSLKQGRQVRIFISEGVVSIEPVHVLKRPDGTSPKDDRPKMHDKEPVSIRKATIGKGGQLVLPEAALEAISLHPGDQVRLFISEGEVGVMPVRSLKQLFGSLKYDGPPISLEQMNEDIARAACQSASARY